MAFDLTKKINFTLGVSGDDRVKTAVKGVEDGLWSAERAVSAAKVALVGLAGIASVNAFKSMVMGSIEATGALHDLSIQSGMSVAALGAFKGVGSYTATSIDTVVAASNKLSKALATQSEDSKGAAAAIQALGLDYNAFKALSPEQQMLAVAKAMDQFADGSGKSAAAMMLFGKSGAEMLPFMKDLADDADKVTATLNDQNVAYRQAQAAMADAFGDNLTALRKNSEGWKKDLSMGLLPALYEGSEVLKSMMVGTNGLSAEVARLARDGTLADWARGAFTALTYVLDVGQGLFSLLPMLGKLIAGVAAGASTTFGAVYEAMSKLSSGDFSGAWEALKGGLAGVRTVAAETAVSIQSIWDQKLVGQQLRDGMESMRGLAVATKDTKAQLDVAAQSSKAAGGEVNKLAGQVDELIARQRQELDVGHDLSEVEKLMLKAKKDLSGAELDQVMVKLRLAKTQEDQIRQLKESAKQTEQAKQAMQRLVESETRRTDQLRDQVDAQDDATFKLGLSSDALHAHEVATLRDRAALRARMADLALEKGQFDLSQQYRDQAEELNRLAEARSRFFDKQAGLDSAKDWSDVYTSIAGGLADALQNGWGSFRDYVKRNVLQYAITPLLQQGVGAVGSWLGGMVGGGTGNSMQAGGNLLQTGSTLYGYGKGVYNWASGLLGGGGSAGAGAGAMTSTYASEQIATMAANGMTDAEIAAALGQQGAEAGGLAGAGTGASSSAWASAGAYAFYAALIYFGAKLGSSLYDKGYTGSDIVGDNPLYRGGIEDVKTRSLKALGVSDKWAEILGGSVRMDWTLEKLGLQATPHVGGYSMATADGWTDITKAMGGKGNAKMQEWTNTFALDMLSLVKGFAKGMGVSTNVAGVRSVYESDNRDGSWGLFHLLDAAGNKLAGRDMLGTLDRDPAKGFKQYTDQAAGAIVDALTTLDLPKWVKKQLAELDGTSTLQDLTDRLSAIEVVRAALDDMATAFSPLGGVFAQLATASSDAKYSLVELSGGMDAFQKRVSDYVSNYYTQDEQAAINARGLLEQARGLGLADMVGGFGSKADLRTTLNGLNVETDTKAIADLLGLSSSFAQIGDYLSQHHMTLADLAALAPQVTGLSAADVGKDQADQAAAQSQAAKDTAENTAEAAKNTADVVTRLDSLQTSVERYAQSNSERVSEIETLLQRVARDGAVQVQIV